MSIKNYLVLMLGLFLSIPLSAAAKTPSPAKVRAGIPHHTNLIEAYQALSDHLKNVSVLASLVLGYCQPKTFTLTKELVAQRSASAMIKTEVHNELRALNKPFNGILRPAQMGNFILLNVAGGKNNHKIIFMIPDTSNPVCIQAEPTDWTHERDYHTHFSRRAPTEPLFASEWDFLFRGSTKSIKIAIIDYDASFGSGSIIQGTIFTNNTDEALAFNLPYLLTLPSSSSSPSSSPVAPESAAAAAPVKDSPLPASVRASSSSSRYHVAPVGLQAAANAVAPAQAVAQAPAKAAVPAKRPMPAARQAGEATFAEVAAQSGYCIIS